MHWLVDFGVVSLSHSNSISSHLLASGLFFVPATLFLLGPTTPGLYAPDGLETDKPALDTARNVELSASPKVQSAQARENADPAQLKKEAMENVMDELWHAKDGQSSAPPEQQSAEAKKKNKINGGDEHEWIKYPIYIEQSRTCIHSENNYTFDKKKSWI